jgi:hypothetical protein
MNTESNDQPSNIVRALCEKAELPQEVVERVLANLSGCILNQDKAYDLKEFLSRKGEPLNSYDLDSAVSHYTNIPRPTVAEVSRGFLHVIEMVLNPDNKVCEQKVIFGNSLEIESSTKNKRNNSTKKDLEYLSVKVSTTAAFKGKIRQSFEQ